MQTLLADQLVLDEDGYYTDYRLIRIREVMRLCGLSKSHIYALAAEGRFPKSVPLVPGGSSRAWIEAEVRAWIQQRITQRDQEVASNA
ncbi:helix-turn-helix transcriptional regulator [Haliea salexigens]|uniref:helix-turn-helix transcriptional regulator n=1 Tax=Haliea salexigens TaxID=287487 RepID=UPI0006871560|nr:AlpA family transcriptional regulator [Haliea salexigens]